MLLSADIGVYSSKFYEQNEINMLISNAFAQTAGAAPVNSSLGVIVELLLIFVIFYFILIRPQQKKIRQHEAMLMAIKKGDKIITGGGILGVVEKVNGDKLDVKIAEGITVTVYRATVRELDVCAGEASVAKDVKISKNKKKK